jgi:hypothetical protein
MKDRQPALLLIAEAAEHAVNIRHNLALNLQ